MKDVGTGRARELSHQTELQVLKVATLGEILVEIMADERGHGFREDLTESCDLEHL